MKRKLPIMTALLLLAATATQAQVRTFSLDASQNSIERSIDDTSSLVYVEESTGVAWFVRYYDNTSYAMAFQLPFGVKVRDVRIWDGRLVYFCGTYTAVPYGLVGMFNINGVFAGSEPVHYCWLDWSTYGDTKPYDLKRLDLFKMGDDSACMAMVGDALFYEPAPEQVATVVSAYFDGSQWEVHSLVRKPSAARFTDIACLDRMIVAAGVDTVQHRCCVKTFRPVVDFPGSPFSPYSLEQLDCGNTVGKVLVAQYAGDTAVLAHHDRTALGTSTVLHRLAFNSTTGLFVAPADTWVTTPPAVYVVDDGEMQELAVHGDTVNVLNRTVYPVSGMTSLAGWILRTTLPATGTNATLWLPNYGLLQSMDLDAGTGNPRASGLLPTLMTCGAAWNNGCNIAERLPLDYQVVTKSTEAIGEYSISKIYLPINTFPSLVNTMYVPECR